MKEIIFMDGFDVVVDNLTQTKTIFSTKLPSDLSELLGRDKMNENVIDNIVIMFNNNNDLSEIDDYLLDEPLVTQDEREIIVENLWSFLFGE